MIYPLYIDGAELGSLQIEPQGLYTCFTARCPHQSGLQRLWVQSKEQEAYLGIMEPGEAGLYLRRSLSRRQLQSFPPNIDRASNTPLALSPPPKLPEPPPSQKQIQPEPELLWYAQSDGCLKAFKDGRWLLAIPARLRSIPRGAELRRIAGGDYLIFRY